MSDSGSSASIQEWDPAWVFSLQVFLVDAAVNCFGYGCLLILAIITIRVLLKIGITSASRRWLLAAVLTFLVASTIQCSGEVAFDSASIAQGPFNGNPGAIKLEERLNIVISVSTRINIIVSECIVVWRAWALADQRALRITLAVIIFLTVGCTLTETVFIILLGLVDFSVTVRTRRLMLYIPLIVNNLFATSVVLYKTCEYRMQLKKELQQSCQKSQVESVLYLLVESGFLYCSWWIFLTIINLVPVPLLMYTIVYAISAFLPALYPMLIILIVQYQKSQREQLTLTALQTLQFNAPPIQDNSESASQSGDRDFVSIMQSIIELQSAERHIPAFSDAPDRLGQRDKEEQHNREENDQLPVSVR